MVVFVDLEDESEPPEQVHWSQRSHNTEFGSLGLQKFAGLSFGVRENPNRNAVAEALGCYP